MEKIAMTVLVQGSVGQEVRNLQTALNYQLPNAAPRLSVDGIFGPRTKARVVEFQQLFGLKVDGIVGPQTHRALYSFVDLSHQLVIVGQRSDERGLFGIQSGLAVGDNSPPPSVLPPLPRLQLPFPQVLPPIPPILLPPRLELDPRLLAFAHNTKFELEVGQEASFKQDLKTLDKPERELALVGDLKATVWSKSFGTKNLELSAGGGMVVEKRIKPSPQTETTVYVFAKAEVKDILKLGPLDIAKLEAEAQVGGKLGTNEPPDMSVSVGAGPEVEVLGGKLTFGPGAYVEYKTNGTTHTLSAQVKATGTFHF
jgi:hypothetical protein